MKETLNQEPGLRQKPYEIKYADTLSLLKKQKKQRKCLKKRRILNEVTEMMKYDPSEEFSIGFVVQVITSCQSLAYVYE